jgi:hypothetical protein
MTYAGGWQTLHGVYPFALVFQRRLDFAGR